MCPSNQVKPNKSTKRAVKVSVPEDKLKVLVNISTPVNDLKAVLDSIESQIDKLEICTSLTRDEVAQWIESTRGEDGLIKDGVLLEGTPSILTVHAFIKWADDFFSSGFKVDPHTGAIDFRQHTGRSSVTEGELLATIVPGTLGKEGKNVLGERIKIAKIKNPKISLGKNVKREEGDNQFFAGGEGRVEFVRGRLSVSDVFIVAGDVGLESGHIDHKGSLLVEKDILEESKVCATGDIEVYGVIDGAEIETSGNLYVRGGICGKEGTRVKVAGDIHAKFILGANIEAGGDIIVEREIVHSIVKSRGAVRVPQGRIAGGEITALGGIEVGEAGTEACIVTRLNPGADYQLEELLHEKRKQIDELREREAKIMDTMKPILPTIKSLPPDKKEGILKLLENAKLLKKEADELQAKVNRQKEKSKEESKSTIMILKSIFPELKVSIQGEHHHFKHELDGPLKVECIAARIRAKSVS